MLCRLVAGAGIAILTLVGSLSFAAVANADSCWNHNGSVMRLVAQNNQRRFYYEIPRPVLRQAGVSRGTLLFDGEKQGDYYTGTARRFSKFCPGNPLVYQAEGPVRRDQLQVTLEGRREVQDQCRGTGGKVWDTLVFTYMYQC